MDKKQRYVPITNEKEYIESLKPFQGKWVALSPDRRTVVSSGTTVEEVESKLEPQQLEQVIFMKVPAAGTFVIA
jgi:predicted RNase H-like HicB family nuclease